MEINANEEKYKIDEMYNIVLSLLIVHNRNRKNNPENVGIDNFFLMRRKKYIIILEKIVVICYNNSNTKLGVFFVKKL